MKTCFLVFSDDFGEHPSSCQHLFRYAPEGATVLWVNTIGMRNPTFSARDLRKAVEKSARMLNNMFSGRNKASGRGVGASAANIHVIQPMMLPFTRLPLARWCNRLLVKRAVNRSLSALGVKSPVIVVTAPNAGDYVGSFASSTIVYYCVDNFMDWPGLDREVVKAMEDKLIRASNILVATSDDLRERLAVEGREVHLMTHGVDYGFFHDAGGEHRLLKDIPRPRVGFFGLFDERADKELIAAVAGMMPDVSFVITGNAETDTAGLRSIKNVYFTGAIPYSELPSMASGWNACMLPYKVNRLTDAIQPLKLKEYMATGKPIISTPIKEALKINEYVLIADAPEKWEARIRQALEGLPPALSKKIDDYVRAESWKSKARWFFDLCG